MARLLSSSGWFAANLAGGDFTPAAGGTATVYADAAATTLANIAAYDGTNTPGPSIVGSTLTIDGTSSLPRFWLPDGAETVWVQVGGGPVVSVSADPTARQDAAEAAWTDYSGSFAVTATTTNPTKGNSTYIAKYKQIGKTVHCRFVVALGTTFAAGSGNYRFSLPVPAQDTLFMAYNGSAQVLDNGTAQRPAMCYTIAGGTQVEIMLTTNGLILGSAGSGTAWAAGDAIGASLTYEAA